VEASRPAGRNIIIVATVAILALILAVGFGIVALRKGSQDLTRIHHLERQVHVLAASSGGAAASVGSRVQAAEGKITALEAKAHTVDAKLSHTESSLSKITTCIPELQTQIGGLELAGLGSNSVYIKDGTNISHDCTDILYGVPSSGE
jgi:hypothetical protein